MNAHLPLILFLVKFLLSGIAFEAFFMAFFCRRAKVPSRYLAKHLLLGAAAVALAVAAQVAHPEGFDRSQLTTIQYLGLYLATILCFFGGERVSRLLLRNGTGDYETPFNRLITREQKDAEEERIASYERRYLEIKAELLPQLRAELKTGHDRAETILKYRYELWDRLKKELGDREVYKIPGVLDFSQDEIDGTTDARTERRAGDDYRKETTDHYSK